MSIFHYIHRLLAIGLLTVLTLVPSVLAQESQTNFTLSDALHQAAEHNPALNAARYSERAAEALTEQAALRPNPNLSVSWENFGGTGALRGLEEFETTVKASQRFERGDKRNKRMAVARSDRNYIATNFEVQRIEVLGATTLAYLKTLVAQQRLMLAGKPLALAEEKLAAAEERVKAGVASPAEPARARAGLASAQVEYARANYALIRIRATLAAQWGKQAESVPALQGTIRVPALLPSEENIRSGLRKNPLLQRQAAIIASRRSALELERAQAFSDITVGAGVHVLRDGSDAGFVAGLSMPLPFRNQNQGNIRAARAHLTRAEQSVNAVEYRLQYEFSAAWQDLVAAHTAVKSLRHEALPATEEAYEIVRRAYAEGQLPQIDVHDAQRMLFSLQRELLEAKTAYALSLARIESLTNPEFPLTAAILVSP